MTSLGNKALAPSVAIVRASKLCRTSDPPSSAPSAELLKGAELSQAGKKAAPQMNSGRWGEEGG